MMYRYCACENTHPSALLCIDEPYVRNLKSTQLNSSILLCPIYFPPLSVVAFIPLLALFHAFLSFLNLDPATIPAFPAVWWIQ